MKLRQFALLAGVHGLGGVLLASGQGWHEPAHAARVPIVLPACAKSQVAGVAIRGADVYRWTGCARPPIHSLRLHGPGGPVPLQVEEWDGTGRLLAKGNGRLDDDDRVVFAVELATRPRALWLYYDGPDGPAPRTSSLVKVTAQPKKYHSLLLTGAGLTIGLHGGGVEPNAHSIQNFGRGGLALWRWQGLAYADVRRGWGSYFPRSIASAKGAPRWSQPSVVLNGPVRTIVEMHCNGYRHMSRGKEVFTGDITHYISIWGRCPVVDFEQIVEYRATGFTHEWPYSFQMPVGKTLDEHDRLIVPLAGKAHVVNLGETAEQVAKKPWRVIYSTDNPEEGWFAWQDTKEKTGLATFYEPMRSIDFRAAWVTYRPALHPHIHTRTTIWKVPEIVLYFRDRALRCRSRYERTLRYVALRDDAPEDIRTQYHVWGRALDDTAKVGWPEIRSRR